MQPFTEKRTEAKQAEGGRFMAQKELALYVAEQLAPLGEIRYIPMMGGWLFYYREKLIGGIYGDGFAVKC